MIGLVMRLREINNQNHRILIHCRLEKFFFRIFENYFKYFFSAGIGRTGVFIALYYLFEAFERRQLYVRSIFILNNIDFI